MDLLSARAAPFEPTEINQPTPRRQGNASAADSQPQARLPAVDEVKIMSAEPCTTKRIDTVRSMP